MSTYLLLLFVIVFLLGFQFFYRKRYTLPADWYLIVSCFLILGGVFFAYPDNQWEWIGLFWWLGTAVLCMVGSCLGESIVKKKILVVPKLSNSQFVGIKSFFERCRFFKYINYKSVFGLYFILAVLHVLLLLYNHGVRLDDFESFSDFIKINSIMQYRYGLEKVTENMFQQILLCFIYAIPLCGGTIFVHAKKKIDVLLAFSSLIPVLFLTLVTNTKAPIIIVIISIISSYLVEYTRMHKQEFKINIKTVAVLLLVFFIFLALVFFTFMLRYNYFSDIEQMKFIVHRIIDYAFGGVMNFDHFFSEFKSMDLSLDHYYCPDSNILSGNGFWIGRYGYIITTLIWCMTGIVSGIAYCRIKEGTGNLLDILLLLYAYLSSVYFFIYLPFSYTTVVIGFFVLFPAWWILFNYRYIDE